MSGQDSRSPEQWRTAKISQIHVAKKQLGMDDDSYRDLLQRAAGVRSSTDLFANPETARANVNAVLAEMVRLGFKPTYKGAKRRTTPAADKAALVGKIKAQLAEAGRTEAYADGVAKRAFKVERFEWLKIDQLHRLAQMLGKDAARHGRTV